MKLYELRKDRKLTQEDVAKTINSAANTYANYEKGNTEPNIETLIKLADFFHVSVDELIEHDYKNTIDKGLLNELELNIIEVMQKLNHENQIRLEASAYALLKVQQDQENIIKRVKGE